MDKIVVFFLCLLPRRFYMHTLSSIPTKKNPTKNDPTNTNNFIKYNLSSSLFNLNSISTTSATTIEQKENTFTTKFAINLKIDGQKTYRGYVNEKGKPHGKGSYIVGKQKVFEGIFDNGEPLCANVT
jgi:hypothetical protein